jgi:hypothetical protein
MKSNIQRGAIFENDEPVVEQVKNALQQIGEKPSRFFKMFRVLRIQICFALALLIAFILLPIRLIYG